MEIDQVKAKLKSSLIVSCQSSEGNPLCTAEHMLLLAKCSAVDGVSGFRADTPDHIRLIKDAFPERLVVGLWKVGYGNNPVYITPTMAEVDALVRARSDIVAVDGTTRIAPTGERACDLIAHIKKTHPGLPVMADVATLEDALASRAAGADMISTTLRGYTAETEGIIQARIDLAFLKILRQQVGSFLVAEGKILTVEDAGAAFDAGADAIVVGTAINNPFLITQRFTNYIEERIK